MSETEKLINRAVRKGMNAADAKALLEDLMNRHEGYNLATALVYTGFAGEKVAHKFAGVEL